MNIPRSKWFIYLTLTVLSFFIWYKLSYPELAFVDIKISKAQALAKAEDHLKSLNINPDSYHHSVIFSFDTQTNRFLQKTIGFEKELEFIKTHDFDLFFWLVRFFKEGEKEEFRLTISSSSGKIIAYKHIIPESEPRPSTDHDRAKQKVEDYLKQNFNINLNEYETQGDSQSNLDKRTEYSFAWQKKSVNIPWSDEENSGTARLISGATIAGDEILTFSKNTFKVPEQFNRYLEKQKEISYNLSPILRTVYYFLFIAGVFILILRRNHLAMHTTKKFYIKIAVVSFILSVVHALNNIQYAFFDFPTTSTFSAYFWRHFMDVIINALFFNVGLLVPCLAGELLHYEILKNRPQGSFLHYKLSTFFSRNISSRIIMGYLICVILLGIQSLLIFYGRKFFGVWTESSWMVQMSSAYIPFLAALFIGFRASFFEEMFYRLFTISYLTKITKHLILAVIFSSIIWGFAHSNYPVYPSWFRGIEVSFIGIFLSFIYLNFGIVTVLIAHYLFDAFWGVSQHLLGQSQPYYFYSSLGILLLPMVWAIAAYLINKREEERSMRWALTQHQQFNLKVLKNYLAHNKDQFKGKSKEDIKKEIFAHGWDIAVIEMALEDE